MTRSTGPRPPTRFDVAQVSVDMATAITAERCMASPDPYRALAGAIGRLAQLQLALRRGKGRRSEAEESAPAGPHRSARRGTRGARPPVNGPGGEP